jgi:hypothetical protein
LIADEDYLPREPRIKFDQGEERSLTVGGNEPDVGCRALAARGLGGREAGLLEEVPERKSGNRNGIGRILGGDAELPARERAEIGRRESDVARAVADMERSSARDLGAQRGSDDGAKCERDGEITRHNRMDRKIQWLSNAES